MVLIYRRLVLDLLDLDLDLDFRRFRFGLDDDDEFGYADEPLYRFDEAVSYIS
jgi:hypothetical protein